MKLIQAMRNFCFSEDSGNLLDLCNKKTPFTGNFLSVTRVEAKTEIFLVFEGEFFKQSGGVEHFKLTISQKTLYKPSREAIAEFSNKLGRLYAREIFHTIKRG